MLLPHLQFSKWKSILFVVESQMITLFAISMIQVKLNDMILLKDIGSVLWLSKSKIQFISVPWWTRLQLLVILCSLLAMSYSSSTCCRWSSTWAFILQAGFMPVFAPRKEFRHFLRSEICTIISFCNSSGWKCQSALKQVEETTPFEV